MILEKTTPSSVVTVGSGRYDAIFAPRVVWQLIGSIETAGRIHGQLAVARQLVRRLCRMREWREREAHAFTAGPGPAGDSRPRSRRGPGVEPFTPGLPGPSERDPLATVTTHYPTTNARRGRADRDA